MARALKKISLLIFINLALLYSNPACGQDVFVIITAYGGTNQTSTCASGRTNTLTVTLKESNGTTLKTKSISGQVSGSSQYIGTLNDTIYRASLPNGWQGKISASGSISGSTCPTVSATLTERTITYSALTGCNRYSFSAGTASTYNISLTVDIFVLLGKVWTLNNLPDCGVTSIKLYLTKTQPAGATFDWQVSQTGAIWYTFRAGATSSITATLSEIHHPSLTGSAYGQHFIRAVSTVCPDYRFTPSNTITFKPPKPGATLTWTEPGCHGDATGKVTVNLTSGGIEDVFMQNLQINLRTATKRIGEDSADVGGSITFGELKAASYVVEVSYNYTSECTTRVDKILGQPNAITGSLKLSDKGIDTLGNKLNVSCFGGNDGSIEVVGATGGTGPYTYSWLDSSSKLSRRINLSAQSYAVTIMDSKDCTRTLDTKLVSPTTHPTVTLTSVGGVDYNKPNKTHYDVSCDAVADGAIQATIKSEVKTGTTDPVYDWVGTTYSQPLRTRLGNGTYSINIKDRNGCPASSSITLDNRPNPIVEVKATHPTCPGTSTGILEVSDTTFTTGTLTYKWSPSNESTQKIINKAAGNYSVSVTDSKGCTGSASISLIDPGSYRINVTPIQAITCFEGRDGSVAAKVLNPNGRDANDVTMYTWKKDGILYDSGSNLSTLTRLADARYECTARYSTKRCNVKGNYDLNQPTRVVASITVTSNYNGSEISCPGESDGSLSVSSVGGRGTYTYKWSTNQTTSTISGKAKGVYSVVATDGNGCSSASVSHQLRDPIPLSAMIIPKSNHNGIPISCHGQQDGWLQAVASGGSGLLSYKWNTGDEGVDLDSIGAGKYEVTVTDQNSCEIKTTKTINDPEPMLASVVITTNYNGQALSCYDASDARVQISSSGGHGSHTYRWNTGDTTSFLNNIPAGTYSAIVKDLNQCPSQEVLVTIENPDSVQVSISIDSDYNGSVIRCHDASDGMLSSSASGGTGAFSYLWSNNETGNRLTGLSEGGYVVTAKDENGCPARDSVFLDAPDKITASIDSISSYSGFGTSCNGSNDGFIEALASGGTGSYSYHWLETTERSYRLSDIGEGEYKVEIRDVNGCTDSVRATITTPPPLTLEVVSKSDLRCYDVNEGSINVNASGGVGNYLYRNNSDDWIDTTAFVDLGAGNYNFEVKDDNGCSAFTSETLIQPDSISISFVDIEPSYCAEPRGKVRGIVSGGTISYSYDWRNSANTFIDSLNLIDSLNAGIYTLYITDSNGCIESKTVGISTTEGPLVAIEESISPLCYNTSDGSVTVSALGNGPFDYTWSNGQTGAQSQRMKKGNYHVTVTDTFGCTTIHPVPLASPTEVKVTSFEKTQPSCNSLSDGKLKAIVEGGVGTYTYIWGSQIAEELTNIPAGKYSVKARDQNGCESKVYATELSQPTALQLNLLSRQLPTCFGACNGAIEVKASGANGGYTYLWSDSTAGPKATGVCAGDRTVSVTDTKGCTLEKTFALGQPDQILSALVKTTRPSCFGGCNGSIEVKASGGTGGYSYLWNNDTQGNKNSNICAGQYSVVVTDKSGCKSETETYDLTQPASIESRLVSNVPTSCNRYCDGSLRVDGSGGNGMFSYLWSNGVKNVMNDKLCAGDYSVTITDSKGCQSKDKLYTVTEPELLSVSLKEMTMPACADACNGTLMIKASGGNGDYHYTWSSGQSTERINELCAGEYTISVADLKSCNISSTYLIDNPAPLTVDLGGSKLVCVGQTHVLDPGESWAKFKWGSNIGITSTAPRLTISKAGQYWLDVETLEGCTACDTFLFETSEHLLEAALAVTAEANVADIIVIIDISWPLPDRISWQYPEQMSVVADYGDIVYGQFFEPGIYEVTLDAELGGCKETMTKTITILENSTDQIGGRLGFEKFVKSFEIYPNPNDGSFDVGIELAEESAVTLSVWSTLTSLNIGTVRNEGNSKYRTHVDLRPLSSGTYVLRLDHAKGYEMIRFIVH